MPDCLPHAAPDEVSRETHTNTQKVCTVLKCVNLWLKFDSDDVQISHAMFTLYSPVSRNDTHTRTQTAVSFMCVCLSGDELSSGRHYS